MNKALINSISCGIDRSKASAIELVCPADTLVQLRSAVDNGADRVQLCFSTPNGPAGTVNLKALASGIRYARDRQRKVTLRVNHPATGATSWTTVCSAIDEAASCGVDAIELSDHALMLYVAARHPHLQLHYAADNVMSGRAIEVVKRHFNVSRLVLPRMLSPAELIYLAREATTELQLHGFCRFSSAVSSDELQAASLGAQMQHDGMHTGQQYCEDDGIQCATAEHAANDQWFSEHNPVEVQVLKLLPELRAIGIRAILIETQGSRPNQMAHVTRIWREAIDECLENADRYQVRPSWIAELNKAATPLRSR